MKNSQRFVAAIAVLAATMGSVQPLYAQEEVQNTGILAIDPAPVDADWWRNRHKEKMEQIEKDPNVELVVLGDSITHGWEGSGKAVFEEFFGKYNSLNIGYGGDRTEHVLWRLQNGEVDGISPKVLVMMIGTNNTGHRKEKPELTALGISLILSELQVRLPETKILLLAVFPRDNQPDGELRQINDKVNQIISRMGDGDQVEFMDINQVFLTDDGVLTKEVMPDMLHPEGAGYRMWAEAISDKVDQLMQDEDGDDAESSGDGFETIFDGKTLDGWRGAEGFWKVEDGALTGETTDENPLKANTFIIWDKQPVKNFELKLKFRLTAGNSGIQYRSQDLGDQVVAGYQADMDFAKQWVGILYDERGRGILATRMQSVELGPGEEKNVSALDGNDEKFKEKYQPEQWNTYQIIADGNTLTHIVNGITTIKVVDQQDAAEESGILAFQLHTGPSMKVQYKDIQFKDLDK